MEQDRNIKEEIDQLYYQIGEFNGYLGKEELPKDLIDCYEAQDKIEVSGCLQKIIELKKEIGEDYSYDEQLLNKL